MREIFTNNLFLFALLLIRHAKIGNGKRNFHIRIDYMNSTRHPECCSEAILNFSNQLPMDNVFIEFRLVKNVPTFKFGVQVDILRGDDSIIRLVDATMNGCKLISSKNKLVEIFTKEVLRVSNFPRKCPLLANKLYYVRNCSVHQEEYPTFLPIVHWIIQIQILMEKIVVASLYAQGAVERVLT